MLVSGDELGLLKSRLVQSILEYTKPYFTKPLKQDDIQRKLMIQTIPSAALEEGLTKYTLQWVNLHISNTQFICEFSIEAKEKVCVPIIEFTDETEPDVEDIELDTLPFSNESPISVQDAREAEKMRVKAARVKAAKYLLRSEQYYKKYVEKWGEPESDWDSSSEEEETDDSAE